MMHNDPWHYQRTDLAQQVLGMFRSGLSNALVFFAPRRMGKTEFLIKDIKPMATDQGWHVLYMSFLGIQDDAERQFRMTLHQFNASIHTKPHHQLQKTFKKLSAGLVGVEFQAIDSTLPSLLEIMSDLSSQAPILLLLDEIQTLAQSTRHRSLIAELRTALDIHKDNIKVIFTGSSREGLRHMFSKSDAPFFHFGQNLPFPALDRAFTNHLAGVFKQVTQRSLDPDELWQYFDEIGKVPQLIRALVERLALHPHLTPMAAKTSLLDDINEDREFAQRWAQLPILSRLLLQAILDGPHELYSETQLNRLAQHMGVENVSISSVQSSLRSMQLKSIITRGDTRGCYDFDDPNFKNWVQREHPRT